MEMFGGGISGDEISAGSPGRSVICRDWGNEGGRGGNVEGLCTDGGRGGVEGKKMTGGDGGAAIWQRRRRRRWR